MADVKDHVSGRGGAAGAQRMYRDNGDSTYSEAGSSYLWGWDTTDLVWKKLPIDHATGSLSTAGGGGGGGAVTIADGADVAQGTTTDLSSANTVIGLLKNIKAALAATLTIGGTVTANAGTNLNTSALALDATLTGGNQKAIARGGAKGSTTAADVTSTASGANHQPLDVAIYDGAGNLKDPTAIRALTSSDVVTANAGTNLNTSALALDATLTGGSQKTKLLDTGGTNVGTIKAASTAVAATDTALAVGLHPSSALPTGANVIGALTANQSVNVAQVNGATTVASVTGVQDVMPRKRTGSTGLSPNYFAAHVTASTTQTITASTAYIQTIIVSVTGAGTSWTYKFQNKEATPKVLVPAITAAVPTTGPVIFQFAEPVLMTSGIDMVMSGTAGTLDVFVTYWQ